MMRKPLLIVALIASLVCPAWQNPIVVKHKSTGVTWTIVHTAYNAFGNTTTIYINGSSPGPMSTTTAGNALVFFYNNNNNTCVSAANVTETGASDTFTVYAASNGQSSCAYYCLSGAGGATAIQVSGVNTTPATTVILVEVKRSTGTATMDGGNTNWQGTSVSSYTSGTAITTTGASDLLLGTVMYSQPTGTVTPSGGFSIVLSDVVASNFQMVLTSQSNVGVGSYNNQGTVSPAGAITSQILALK